jgi:excinuclease UvrABC nuclease subunit
MSAGTWSPFITPYKEAEVNKYAPSRAGVYTLWVKYNAGYWECFYVGKTDNIESRLLDHIKDTEPNECIKGNVKYKCGFSWIEITTEDERSGAEKYLYDNIKPRPECNKTDPGGTPLKIPLPPTPPSTTT